MNDENLAQMIIACFLQDIPLQIQSLKKHLEAGNAESIERQAHTIKGASATVGGESLRETAAKIEKSGSTGDLAGAQSYMGELELGFAVLKEILKNEIQVQS